MATLHTDSAEHSHEYRFVSLIKRTPDGTGDPHVVQLSEINTIEKLLHISQRLFDTDIPPRIFTENNCPIPYTCWVDTARGTGRSGQHFYLEIYEQQYTKGTNRSSLALPAPAGNASSSPGKIRPVIFVIYPEGLFSTHPLPDDLIVECIPLDIKLGALADNIKEFLSREFSPNVNFTIRFENASNSTFDPGDTVKEAGIVNGALVYCRLGLLDFPN